MDPCSIYSDHLQPLKISEDYPFKQHFIILKHHISFLRLSWNFIIFILLESAAWEFACNQGGGTLLHRLVQRIGLHNKLLPLYYWSLIPFLLYLLAFEKLVRFVYSGDKDIVAAVKELDLLFEMFRLADQVSRDRAWELREARQSSQGVKGLKTVYLKEKIVWNTH